MCLHDHQPFFSVERRTPRTPLATASAGLVSVTVVLATAVNQCAAFTHHVWRATAEEAAESADRIGNVGLIVAVEIGDQRAGGCQHGVHHDVTLRQIAASKKVVEESHRVR